MSRYDDQDVAALYCAMRDAVYAITERPPSRWERFLRWMMPARGARMRMVASVVADLALGEIERVYREWQAARVVEPTHDEPLETRMNTATALGIAMVRAALKKKRDEALPPEALAPTSAVVHDQG
jgi:hypothetical protein